MKQFLKRTTKYLVMGYYIDSENLNQNNISKIDESFIDITHDNITKITNLKQENKFNFYNKYSTIGGSVIGSLVNKFSFKKSDFDEICQVFNNIQIVNTTDERCYNSLKQLFSNDITYYEEIKDFDKWVDLIPNDATVYVTLYDLKYLGGTAGITFGHKDDENLPLIITERALEYIKSDKVIVKTGTLEKEMSGISSINFKLQPTNFVKGWLFSHKNCIFEPKSLIVEYKGISSDYSEKDGISTIVFEFVPIEADTFYKNKMMFETQNRFFDWAISAATKPESDRDVMRSGLEIPMRLKSIEVINNTFRNNQYGANEFLSEIMNNLGFTDNDVMIVDKKSNSSQSDIKYILSNDASHDPNGYTECIFKAYL